MNACIQFSPRDHVLFVQNVPYQCTLFLYVDDMVIIIYDLGDILTPNPFLFNNLT